MHIYDYEKTIRELAAESYRIKDNPSRYAKPVEQAPGDGNSPEKTDSVNALDSTFFEDVALMEIDRDLLSSLFGTRWRESILSILSIVEMFKNRTSTRETTILYLPTTSKYLTDVFGNHQNVSNAIRRCKRIGLLKCVDESYRFGIRNPRSKLYAWNKKAERLVLDFCKRNGIVASIPHSLTMSRVLREAGTHLGWKEKAKGYDIRITQRTALPKTLTDEEVVDALLERYPQIGDAMETAVRLNRSLPESEQISAMPRIQRSVSGTITKIGYRITNPIVSAKVHDNQNDDYHGPWLKDILSQTFGTWAEYDVKSSIYRVSHLLAYGEWLPPSIDLYEDIAGFRFGSQEERRNFKQLAMSLYFENSAKSLLAHYSAKGMPEALSDRGGLVDAIEEARANLAEVCGESLRSEVFVHESCIYLEAFRRMVEEKGGRVIQVYDGFYIRTSGTDSVGDTTAEAERIVAESAMWYLRTYFRDLHFCSPC